MDQNIFTAAQALALTRRECSWLCSIDAAPPWPKQTVGSASDKTTSKDHIHHGQGLL